MSTANKGRDDVREATLRQLYENYGLTTEDLEWEPSYVSEAELSPPERRTKLPVKDWDKFGDPFKLFFQDYVRVQSEKETVFHDAIRLADRFSDARRINPRWVAAMKLYYPAVVQSEAEAHRGHMSLARHSPSATLAMASFYQVLDELRHAQNDLHALRYWAKHIPELRNWAQLYQNFWALQVLRHDFEDMMTPSDPFELLFSTNVALEMGFTNTLFVATPTVGAANGDKVFAQLQMSTQSDETRHIALGQAALRVLLEQDNRDEYLPQLQYWLDKWTWRQHRAFGIAGIFMDYFAENKTMSYAEAFQRYFIEGFVEGLMEDFEPLGLKPPRFLDTIISEATSSQSHQIWKLAFQYSYLNYFDTFPPTEADKAWLREKYPGWDELVGSYWDGVDNGASGQVAGLPLICNLCQFPIVYPSPDRVDIKQHEHNGRRYWFCSDGCKYIFEHEPEKYQDSKTLVEMILEGDAPASIEDLREYMGVEEGWGGNLFEKDVWKDWEASRSRAGS
jgi:phenol/toluene 2-monooxygenase (NADH) P3/A3